MDKNRPYSTFYVQGHCEFKQNWFHYLELKRSECTQNILTTLLKGLNCGKSEEITTYGSPYNVKTIFSKIVN